MFKKIINACIKRFLRLLWESPQILCSLLYLSYLKIIDNISYIDYDKINKVFIVNICTQQDPFSLGLFVFLPDYKMPHTTIKHEIGHSKQSTILGPLYLFIVCIPGLVWHYMCVNFNIFKNINYYWFYTEKWADKLSGITRLSDEKGK